MKIIDAEQTALTDLLKELKELWSGSRPGDVDIAVLVNDKKAALRVKAFASMSGFSPEIAEDAGRFRISISGTSCGCFR